MCAEHEKLDDRHLPHHHGDDHDDVTRLRREEAPCNAL